MNPWAEAKVFLAMVKTANQGPGKFKILSASGWRCVDGCLHDQRAMSWFPTFTDGRVFQFGRERTKNLVIYESWQV
jgi:hypothetical protein